MRLAKQVGYSKLSPSWHIPRMRIVMGHGASDLLFLEPPTFESLLAIPIIARVIMNYAIAARLTSLPGAVIAGYGLAHVMSCYATSCHV